MEVTCLKCGWVHFAVTREHAEAEVKKFNDWFEKQDEETKSSFGGKPSSIELYDRCFNCGQTEGAFRPSEPGDCPDGCTIQPTIWEPPDASE